MKEKEKKTNGIQLLLRCVVRDPDGKMISDTGRKSARSFVIQFLEFIRWMFLGTGTRSATATDGSEDTIYYSVTQGNPHFRADAGAGDSTYGVVVGTGDTAETNTDYRLVTQLTEGVGVGNITYGTTSIAAPAVVGPNVDLEINRSFTNLTGSSIGVKEAGIYVKYTITPNYHCIIRDVLAGTVNVPDKCSLTVYYTLRTTV